MKIDKEVKIAFWISIGALIIVFLSALFIYHYDDNFVKNVFVEAHGMVFDLLVIATFLFWLQTRVRKKRTREQNIQRWFEEIDDLRGWEEKEAGFRIIGNIKRLNREGITSILLHGCFLEKVNLDGANLTKSNLCGTSLKESSLSSAKLTAAYLSNSNLWNANLSGADLSRAHLQEACLRLADLNLSKLNKANFIGADLRGIKNLTIKQLSQVETLYNTKIDQSLRIEIKNKYPHLLEKPKHPTTLKIKTI